MIWGPNYALQQTKATTNQFWKDIFNFLKMYVMVIIILPHTFVKVFFLSWYVKNKFMVNTLLTVDGGF